MKFEAGFSGPLPNKFYVPHNGVELLLKTVVACAYAACRNSSMEGQCPEMVHYSKRMREPEPGDLVVEVTNWSEDPIDRIGRLLSVDGDTYRIKTMDERELSWSNSEFMVIPEDAFDHPGSLLKVTSIPHGHFEEIKDGKPTKR